MTQRTARIRVEGPDRSTVEVNDHDLSAATRGYTLSHQARELPQLTLDLLIHEGQVEGEMRVWIPPDTAAALVALGWTPPDDGQPVDLTAPERHDQMIKIIKRETRRDPDWFRTLLRREARMQGGKAPTWLPK